MLDNNKMVKVTNRNRGSVGYTIPDLNLHRVFASKETKTISMDELQRLSYIPGGDVILKKYLVIEDEEVVRDLLNKVEPEYYYTEEDIKTLLEKGSLDQLEDCLKYAPEGVINTLKQIAVELPLNDVAKRKLILDKIGFNINSAISIMEADKEEENEKTEEKAKSGRKAAPITATETKSKYTIIK